MKNSLKKFFLLGLAVAAAGVAISQIPNVKRAVTEMVKKRKLTKVHAEELKTELEHEIKRFGAKKAPKAAVKKAVKKVVKK